MTCTITSSSTHGTPPVASVPRIGIASNPPPPPADSDSDDDEDDDPNYRPKQSNRDYFTDPAPANDRHTWLVGFYKFLNTPDCGRKRAKNRLQHASQAKQILEDLDPNGTDLDILSQDEGYIVWTDWVDPRMEDMSSGTIRSYLCTYQWFLKYVTVDRIRKSLVPDLHPDVLLILRATLTRLQGWRKTVDLEMRPKRSEKPLKECDTRLTNSDVKAFTLSKICLDAVQCFQDAKDGQVLTATQLCLVRDFLIAELTITTGTRPGALGNATVAHLRKARPDATSGLQVMLVPDHKRGVDGPAPKMMAEKTRRCTHPSQHQDQNHP